jgi:hypothetical protein
MVARDEFKLSFKLPPLANGLWAKYGKMMVLLRLSVDMWLRFAPPKCSALPRTSHVCDR